MSKGNILIIAVIILSGLISILTWRGMRKDLTPQPEIVITIEPAHNQPVIMGEVKGLEKLGEFKLTAYCSCSKCCGKYADNRPNGKVVGATGEELIAGYSIAVDPKVIPYGTVVLINGQEYKAMDCGGKVKGNRIDVYFSDHSEAVKFGVQTAEVTAKIF